MANILIRMKDGTEHRFDHVGRSGGSYTKHMKLEAGWVTVEDEWGKRTAFPSSDVLSAQETDHMGRW